MLIGAIFNCYSMEEIPLKLILRFSTTPHVSNLTHVYTVGPCLSNGTCFPGVSCLNVGVGQSQCGPCPKGYEGDGRTCNDIDEVGYENDV